MGVWAAVAGAVIGGVGSYLEAEGSKDATKDYNRQQRKLDTLARDWNYQRFLESRGQGGQALLPLYFPQGTETGLANDALATYTAERAAAGTPSDELASYLSAVQSMTPAMNAGDALVNRLFNGQLTEEEIRNIQPVLEARGKVATSQKKGILEGLNERLNALSADRAKAGYVGGGSAFQKNLLTGATIPALQAAGTVGAQADLANATDVANLRNQGIQTQLANVNLPLSRAASRIQLNQMPQAAQQQAQAQRMALFNWFKMNPQAYQWNNIPNQMLTPNDMMIIGATMKGAGSGASSFSGLGKMGSSITSGSTSGAWSSGSDPYPGSMGT